eukprot:521402_1
MVRQRTVYIPPAPQAHQMRVDPNSGCSSDLYVRSSFNHSFANSKKLSESEFSVEIQEINAVYKSNRKRGPGICIMALAAIAFICGFIGVGIGVSTPLPDTKTILAEGYSFPVGFTVGYASMGVGMVLSIIAAIVWGCTGRKALRAVTEHLVDLNRKYSQRGLNFRIDFGYLWIEMTGVQQIMYIPQQPGAPNMHMQQGAQYIPQQPAAQNMYMQQAAPNMYTPDPPAYQPDASAPVKQLR